MKINQKGFTLVEIIIVTAILAVLSTAAVFILNPAEIIKQTRDSQRLSDLNTTVSALSLFNADSSSTGGLGTINTLYISLSDDTSSTCASITGLPPLAGSVSYHCVTQINLKNVNNSGWIPVNFTSMSISSPFSVLPRDPVNTGSNYYKYSTNTTQFELATPLESQKYQPYMTNDGGDSDTDYETGNSLSLVSGFSNLPTVTSPTATSITSSGATLGANITSDGGATLTARGTCWATTATPTTNCLAEGLTTTGIFTHIRSSMSSGTLIYYRGYATNSIGTGYSADGSFTTLTDPTTTAINPTSAINNTSASITSVSGTNFVSGATVKLTKDAQSDISCTGFTFTTSTTLSTGSCPITGAATGTWNVAATNPDAQVATLSGGFTISALTTGSLTSSTYDTGFTKGVNYNSLMWKGSLGTGGVNYVTFQFAASNCSNGATNAPAC